MISISRRRFMAASAGAAAASLPGLSAVALEATSSDVLGVNGDGKPVRLSRISVDELAKSLRGPLLKPGMEQYDVSRHVFNASIDKYPALIAQCTGVADVQHAVNFARDYGLLVAVRGGGHSFSGKGTCDGGLVIDLSPLRGVRVDPRAQTAVVAGGSLLGQLDHESMAFDLVTTAGTVSHTGVGGLTLGGGFGRLGRRFGLTLDNVRGVEIVTADGKLKRANAEENADLYWGVRGGGGNFGVVTAFDLQLHAMQRTVVAGEMGFAPNQRKAVLQFYADFAATAPRELYLDCIVPAGPDGKPGPVILHACYSGDPSKAERALEPLDQLGKPLFNQVRAIDYVELQRSWDQTDPRSNGEYQKSGFFAELSADLVEAASDGYSGAPGRSTTLFLQHAGGAIGDVSNAATAFAHRETRHASFASVSWPLNADPEPHISWLRDYWSRLEPHTIGFYTNDIDDQSQADINRNYRGNYDRLVQVKKRYDPANLFRLNANVSADG